MTKAFSVERIERRVPIAVAVSISGHASLPGVESTFTENISSRGARVVTVRRWRANDCVEFSSLPGEFHARARVAYCHRLSGDGYAIGLEFLEQAGHWVISGPPVPGKSLHG
ncbi:MAG: PilZ domain-containing protein [Candidatus Acidiferrales bacterium]